MYTRFCKGVSKLALSEKTKEWLQKNVGVSFENKHVLITGATSGIGLKSAEIMLYLKAGVIMACRDCEKANRVRERLLYDYPDADIEITRLDIADFASVDAFARELERRKTDIDVFLNNAGVFHKPNSTTMQGFEGIIGTNYLGVYYLSERILPYLSSLSHEVLYINTVSIIYKVATVDYNDFFYSENYGNFKVYGRSKLCLAVYTYKKAADYKASNVKIVMSHPGIAITPLGINAFGKTVGSLAKLISRVFNSPEKSALSLPFIMANPFSAGDIIGPSKLFGGWGYPRINKPAKKLFSGANRLIEFTEELIKDK